MGNFPNHIEKSADAKSAPLIMPLGFPFNANSVPRPGMYVNEYRSPG